MCNYSDYIERSGIKQGIEQGKAITQKDNAVRMNKIGFKVDQIAASLGLTEDQVKQILQDATATV
jgi:predicted transposase/invertase (TIGR01784 family)